MGRILAIDYGRKRTGLAVTDPLQIIASPLLTLPTGKLEEYLSEYLKNEKVDAIVVGYPKKMNNTPSEAVKYINPFLKRIRKLFPDMPVYLEDERLTSIISQKTILEGGVKKKERMDKSLADKISASLILQSFLEKREFES
ncbi:MAG TPA: Holliday junction resolvase RuvX [Bacteroidales bacterium]|nr:Holliday junction resolvase RuvX [Bacteroidales bacterium]HCI55395.1 Holliday junction resolvase RuvX [Bacteroidales bacterium]HOU95743.1 Holliday junction resolvase RuvX [Bacteroidales bacterium]HQG36727.1 Holliday junction resolvase RuvX [Bacteroidales bacterium]HQG52869.1 Holliday junction resolvase RuvX [Bacteroidales bacterium]